MGEIYETQCKSCGHVFELEEGGGFTFSIWYCNACGSPGYIPNHPLDRPDWLGGPDYKALGERSADEWQPSEEDLRCECGGRFTPGTPPRCPECGATDIEKGETVGFID
jgi:PHP family Zn ribbon phosphoesterase